MFFKFHSPSLVSSSKWDLGISEAQAQEMVVQMQNCDYGAELRVELPASCLLFIKRADPHAEESRFLLAHPEEEVWVGTWMLCDPAWRGLQKWLGSAQSGDELALDGLGAVARVSNMSVTLKLESETK